MWCVYKISGQIILSISTYTDKYFLSKTHYFHFFAQTTTFAVLDPLISGSDYIPDCIKYSTQFYITLFALQYIMITITIRLTDIWKKSNSVTYSAKIFLEPDYQTVHGAATEQSKWKQRAMQPIQQKSRILGRDIKNLHMIEGTTLNVFSIRNLSTHASSKHIRYRQDVSFNRPVGMRQNLPLNTEKRF